MTTIFISYRRDDAAAYAGRLYDGLRQRYGEDHVFMDVDRIQPGENFAAVIERSIRNADVVLVVIGEAWLTVTDESGKRRLDDPEDFVHLEIKAALDCGRRVIPVLVGDAVMPGEQALPPALRRLAGVQAVTLSNERWDYDAERLTRSIDGGEPSVKRRRWFWGAGALALIAVALAWFMTMRPSPGDGSRAVTLRAAPAALSTDAARAMVAQRDFFHARWNAAGGKTPLALAREVLGTDIVVTDTRHQLMWQQRASPSQHDRDGARQYVRDLNARRFAGHGDWRLPTLEEAMSLVEPGAAGGCRLNPLFERSGLIARTADTVPDASEGERDWIVYFCDGIAAAERPVFNAQVRAVRSLR